MMNTSSSSFDQLSALIEVINGPDFKQRLSQLRSAEATAHQAEAAARTAKKEAEAALRQIGTDRAALEALRAKLAEDERRVDEKLARARALFEFTSAA
jgi:hypothetical protein